MGWFGGKRKKFRKRIMVHKPYGKMHNERRRQYAENQESKMRGAFPAHHQKAKFENAKRASKKW